MKLTDTIDLMWSTDYKDRLKAECLQLTIRLQGLKKVIEHYDDNTLPFKPTCSKALLKRQYDAMYNYLTVLRYRAVIEGVELPNDCELYG